MAKPRGFSSGFGPGFGVGRYYYELTPYVWDTSFAPHFWRLPLACVGGVDLRPLAAQAIAGGSPQGLAFAASLQSTGGVRICRALHFSEEPVTVSMRDAWESATGFRANGQNAVDLLWDQLTVGADPSGEDGPKPLMPGADNVLRLFVGGHLLVKSERFRWGVHSHTNRVQAVLQRDFEQLWEATGGHDHCCRVLDFYCKKYRCEDWKSFVPSRLRSHVPGRLPHATTITESFNKADSTTLGPDLTWTEYTESYASDTWAVVSNEAVVVPSGLSYARAESDLSSDDHYAQANVTAIGSGSLNHQAGAVVRFSSSAVTGYVARAVRAGLNDLRLEKTVAGTLTGIAGPTSISIDAPYVVKVSAEGSTIKGYRAGVELLSVTDTAVTGNLRGGLFGFASGTTLDDFEAADIAAGGVSIPILAYHYNHHLGSMG